MILGKNNGKDGSLAFLVSFTLILINFILKRYQDTAISTRSFKRIDIHKFSRFAAILCIASLIIGILLPIQKSQTAGMSVEYQKRFNSISEFFETLFEENALYFNSGFESGDVSLGGNLRLDYTKVLEVRSSEPVYLIGGIYDIYLGDKWRKSDSEFLPSGGKLHSMLSEKVETQKIRVEITQFFTDDIVFYPPYPESIILPHDLVLLTDGRGEFRAVPMLNPSDTYYITAEKPVNIEELVNKRLNRENIENFQKYLTLPDALPKEIVYLAKELTANAKSDYEKAVAIQQYLLQNYTYSLTPGNLPVDFDFTEYFLFYLKQGYCTYFATAMTVLCRAAGIPALYVTGYKTDERNYNGGVYNVLKKDAHAWTIVYINGVGWIIFDATPSAFFDNGTGTVTSHSNQSGETSDVSSGYISSNFTSSVPSSSMPSTSISSRDESDLSVDDNITNNQYAAFVWIAIAVLFAVLFVIRVVSAYLKQKKIFQSKGNNSVILIFNEMFRIARFFGYNIKAYETPLRYFTRISKQQEFNGYDILKLVNLYYAVEFGRYLCSDEEIAEVHSLYNSLISGIKQKNNKLKFLFYRYVLNRI
ncbi:MAG TPA: transglutaminase domain-containing protein [Clostridiales bacterium]|nr:transglutaminase domain-containing protein [Clostridiales bacterium]